jgi:hypothetical protein
MSNRFNQAFGDLTRACWGIFQLGTEVCGKQHLRTEFFGFLVRKSDIAYRWKFHHFLHCRRSACLNGGQITWLLGICKPVYHVIFGHAG